MKSMIQTVSPSENTFNLLQHPKDAVERSQLATFLQQKCFVSFECFVRKNHG